MRFRTRRLGARRYVFISTVSVYDVDDPPLNGAESTPAGRAALAAAGGVDETAPVLRFDAGPSTTKTNKKLHINMAYMVHIVHIVLR